jgi:hypothetical protein
LWPRRQGGVEEIVTDMLASLAMAAALTLDKPCDYAAFYERPSAISLYRVKAPGRTRFLEGSSFLERGCSDDKPCVRSAYLVKGDVVAVSHQRAGRACAVFKGSPKPVKRGTRQVDPVKFEAPVTLDWLPMSALEPVGTPHGRPASAWDGEWVGEAQLIDIRPRGQTRLQIKGIAYYASVPEAVKTGSVNIGDLDGLFFRDGDTAEGAIDHPRPVRRTRPQDWTDGRTDCAARMWLVGPYLFVEDNQYCGGLNVSFGGVYRR